MTARYLDTLEKPEDLAAVAASFAHARQHELRYRVAVGARNPAEVVRFAGGWLFDRVHAGWDVTVVVSEHGDPRPLQILGANVLHLDDCLAWATYDTWPHLLVLDTALFDTDPRVLSIVMATVDTGRSDVMLWGDVVPDEMSRRMGPVSHRLSSAAKAFKARACTAAAVPAAEVDQEESFRLAAWPVLEFPRADMGRTG
ncbi:hypothetical protein [Nocardia sp. NPDC057668]|uniref:hypothetical protein n=1 Tax=Nocardia sp. NPDC057668 TaxID=3346202 RepID=UPI00366C7EB3